MHDLKYLSGFANHFTTEAVPGALPQGQNSPQQVPFGLYAEQLSGTAFTAPRSENKRSWLYRLRPTAQHDAFKLMKHSTLTFAEGNTEPPTPNRLRWSPKKASDKKQDFLDSLFTLATNGSLSHQLGGAVHLFDANRSMSKRCMMNADGELLIIPYSAPLEVTTELGKLFVEPLQIVVIPRGVRFKIDLHQEQPCQGYILENYGALFRLPELGPIGSNGLANSRDFDSPVAWFEDRDEDWQVVQKFSGKLWTTTLKHSPFDVVAWHGNLSPYRYDLRSFNTIGTVSYDHPDPSIFTVLTSPSDQAGTANWDFVIFPPRWMVAENTFRPPWFHRNVMSEFMGLIHGAYDAKEGGFSPGGSSLHNCMNGHGPDQITYEKATEQELKPVKISDTMAFMFESRMMIAPTAQALKLSECQSDYDEVWKGFKKATIPHS